jgi:hypothetical protein
MISRFAAPYDLSLSVIITRGAWPCPFRSFRIKRFAAVALRRRCTKTSRTVYFRDTAHGLLTWALATLIVVGVLSSAVSSLIGAGVQAAATATSGATTVAVSKAGDSRSGSSYFVDSLLRPADPRKPTAANGSDTSASQVATILANSAMTGSMSPDDPAYLTQRVAAKTGLSDGDAKARIDAVIKNVDDAKAKAQQRAEATRKATARIALFGTLSLLIGAFIAAVAAVIGGRERDDMEAF